VKVASLGNKNKRVYFVLLSTFATFTQKVKVGGVSVIQTKVNFCLVLLSTCTTFTQKVKVGGVSVIKINEFILYYSRLSLPLLRK
jgi:uncharacterized pyridoxamine 5'-phosphate oxidase family protein